MHDELVVMQHGEHAVRRRGWQAVIAVLATTCGLSAAAMPARAEQLTNRTVFATKGTTPEAAALWRLTLDATGAVVAKTPVHHGSGGTALDVAGGRMIFGKRGPDGQPQIWLRESSGLSRYLTAGIDARFTPGATAVAVTRRVDEPDDVDEAFSARHELYMHYLADGHERRLTPLLTGHAVELFQYSPDGLYIWLLMHRNGGDWTELVQYGLRERAVVFRRVVSCNDFEMLPSGLRMVLACRAGSRTELQTMHLGTRMVRSRTVLPEGFQLYRLHGRVAADTLLASAYVAATHSWWLGALDLKRVSVRRLVGTSGYVGGTADY